MSSLVWMANITRPHWDIPLALLLLFSSITNILHTDIGVCVCALKHLCLYERFILPLVCPVAEHTCEWCAVKDDFMRSHYFTLYWWHLQSFFIQITTTSTHSSNSISALILFFDKIVNVNTISLLCNEWLKPTFHSLIHPSKPGCITVIPRLSWGLCSRDPCVRWKSSK